MRGARPADAPLGSGVDVTSNEWVRFAESRHVRAGGAPACMKTASLTGRGGSAAPRRTFGRSGGARPLGPPAPSLFSGQDSRLSFQEARTGHEEVMSGAVLQSYRIRRMKHLR